MNTSEICMNFSHSQIQRNSMLGVAVAKAHHGICSFSSDVTSKPKRSLESSGLVGNITVLPDQDDQGLERPTKLCA